MSYFPVIIIGMHRSGTSLLSRILEKLGVFMGAKKEENNEALFFLKFNDWVLKQANATWDNPYNYTLSSENFKSLMTELAEKYIRSVRRFEYLGLKKGIKYRNLKNLDFLWGWKDPRNTFTLDIWIRVFPNAKIIHIYRNPIDVAESLRKRTLEIKENFKWSIRKEFNLLLTKGYLGYGDSARVESIFEGVKLWKEYVSRVFELERKLNLKMLHIKYEEFLKNPIGNMEEIQNAIGLDIKEEDIRSLVKDINPDRKYAFLRNENLIKVYENIKGDELLRKLGYDDL